jgi:hypothetical protein
MEEETFFWLFRVHKLVVKIIYVPRTHSGRLLWPRFAIVLFHSGSEYGQSRRRRNQNSRKSIRAKNETAKENIKKLAIINQSEGSYIQEMNKNEFEFEKKNKTNK